MSDDLDGLRQGAKFAGMVSMAIPPPEGPIIMSALQIFGALLPTPPKPDVAKEIFDAIHALPQLIGNDATLGAARNKLASINSGVQKIRDEWTAASGQDYEVNTIDSCRKEFNPLWTVGSDVAGIFSGLTTINTVGADGFIAGRAAVAAYMNLLLGFIVANKVYVELQGGKVAALARRRQAGERNLEALVRDARRQLRADFDQLVVNVRDYSDAAKDDRKTLQALIDALRKARAGLATVKTEGENSADFVGAPTSYESHYIDDPGADPRKQNEAKDTSTTRTDGDAQETVFNCVKQSVDDALPGYQSAAVAAFDAAMADATKIYDALRAQIDQIEGLVPDDPKQSVGVEWIDVGLPGYWTLPGKAVCWGIQYQRGSNSSRVIWSDWFVAAGDTKIPKLTLPIDTTVAALTQTRAVYRMTHDKPGTAPPPMQDPPADADTVLLLPDNTTGWACDAEMDAARLGLPPLPQGPPVAPDLAPAPESDAGARRYSYTYRSTTSESPLGASPETPWLTLKWGDALYVPNVGDWTPVIYSRGRNDAKPLAAGGTATADGNGQMWTWKIFDPRIRALDDFNLASVNYNVELDKLYRLSAHDPVGAKNQEAVVLQAKTALDDKTKIMVELRKNYLQLYGDT